MEGMRPRVRQCTAVARLFGRPLQAAPAHLPAASLLCAVRTRVVAAQGLHGVRHLFGQAAALLASLALRGWRQMCCHPGARLAACMSCLARNQHDAARSLF